MDATSIVMASIDLERSERAERERRYPERLYRAVSVAIDRACDQVEIVNSTGGGPCPPRVGALIEYLLLLAGEPGARPATSVEALDVLFYLAEVLLGRGVQTDAATGAVPARRGRAA